MQGEWPWSVTASALGLRAKLISMNVHQKYYIKQNITKIISNIINAVTVTSCNYCCNIIDLYRFILNYMALFLLILKSSYQLPIRIYSIKQNITEMIRNIINVVTVTSCNYCCNIIILYRFILNYMALDLFNYDRLKFLDILMTLDFLISRKCRSWKLSTCI